MSIAQRVLVIDWVSRHPGQWNTDFLYCSGWLDKNDTFKAFTWSLFAKNRAACDASIAKLQRDELIERVEDWTQ